MAFFLPVWLKKRAAKGKEDPSRLKERDGIASVDRPRGKLVWLHAASVGESLMLLPLIQRLTADRRKQNVLITTGTVTSAELLEQRLEGRAIHQYAPADHPKAVKRFLDHWQPDLAIFAESELWPNMILMTKDTGAKLALINARMSPESIERWNKRKKSGKALLGAFDLILAANEETANGLAWLLDRDITYSGNLKLSGEKLPVNDEKLAVLKKALGRRKVWCAASTHGGEEALVLGAHTEIKKRFPSAHLILAPRHPERCKEVVDLIKAMGLSYVRHSQGRLPEKDTDIYLIDVMGRLGLAYELAPVSFVGGSLKPELKGHNPLEPARHGSAIIAGQYISSFADTYLGLMTYEGARRVMHPSELADAVIDLLSDDDARQGMIEAAGRYAASQDAVLDHVWSELDPLLPTEV